jgi:hypothetical protein
LLDHASPHHCGEGGIMKPSSLLVLLGMLAAAPAFAAGTLPEKANAKAAAHAALSDDAGEPDVKATAPALPSTASPKATNALSNIAFGVQGAKQRAAHSKAGQHAADQAGDEGASRSAQGAAASAARSANADSHAAAGVARAAARTGAPTGTPPAPRGR